MTELLESNSWKLWPRRSIATIDGASVGAIGAECASPTSSSCGTTALTMIVSSSQPRMIGMQNTRSMWAKNGRRVPSV